MGCDAGDLKFSSPYTNICGDYLPRIHRAHGGVLSLNKKTKPAFNHFHYLNGSTVFWRVLFK